MRTARRVPWEADALRTIKRVQMQHFLQAARLEITMFSVCSTQAWFAPSGKKTRGPHSPCAAQGHTRHLHEGSYLHPAKSTHAPRATGVDGVNHLTGAGPKTTLLYGPYI